MKELIFVHDWIGPQGPIHNGKTPDIYDFAKRAHYINCERVSSTDEIDPLIIELKRGNHTRCRSMPSYEVNFLENGPFLYELQLSQKYGFNYINLSSGIGFLNHAPVDQHVLNLVREGKGFILVTCVLESFLEDYVFSQFYNYFSEHNIPIDRVIYLSNCANAQDLHLDWCNRHNVTPKLNCEYIGLYILNQSGILQDERFTERQNTVDQFYKKKKLFLNLNRRFRDHRYAILLKMKELKILDKFSISFDKPNCHIDNWLADISSFCNNYNIKLSRNDLEDIYHSLPFILDNDNFSNFPMEEDLFSTSSLYDETFISIVSETNFENNIIHLTEKSIKPIVFKHPFITVGPAGTLAYFKKLGFKTFEEFWDERYDLEKDPVIRMNKIFEIIDNISKWSSDSLMDFYIRSQDIINYNFELFKYKQDKDLKDFVEKYGIQI